MPYTITLTNGTFLTTIADATVDNTTSLTLIGRNFAGYGGYIAEDLVHMLENAANTTPPSAPLKGQLWFNANTLAMQVWNGTTWVNVGLPPAGTDIDIVNAGLILENDACPANQRKWRISVSNTVPYVGMLVFQALNDDLTVKNTVMALDGVNNLILGHATYS